MLNKQGNKTESDKTYPCTAKPSQQQKETTATKFSNRKSIGTLRQFITRISLLQRKTVRTNRQYSSASSSRHFNDHNQTAGSNRNYSAREKLTLWSPELPGPRSLEAPTIFGYYSSASCRHGKRPQTKTAWKRQE
jgi:hypothetical protein